MKNLQEVQLAWHILELLQTLADLIWECYQEDFIRDIKNHEHRRDDAPWEY